jgi:transposase
MGQIMTADIYAGIDVAKETCALALEEGAAFNFEQTPPGFAKAMAWLKAHRATHIVLEPSGGYEKGVGEALAHAGLQVCFASPAQVRAFAKAKGLHAKTDALDAHLLASFGRTMKPKIHSFPDKVIAALADFVHRRRQLIAFITQERQREEQVKDRALLGMIRAHLKLLEKQLVAVDAGIAERIAQEEPLAQKQAVLEAVPGVGKVTAAVLLAEMPELGSLDAKQAASLSGLAPYNRESGKSARKAFVRGGRPGVKCALYMAAVSAVRHNPAIREFYRRLRKDGKPAKLALIAAARKLIVILNAKIRDMNSPMPNQIT